MKSEVLHQVKFIRIRVSDIAAKKKSNLYFIFCPLQGLHGIHIHQNGDTSENCAASALASGGFFNPNNRKVHQHHDGGKLENIQADSNGVSSFQLEIPSKISTLYGKNSIIGRTLVIHNDDGNLENETKLVCGIIRKKDISTNSTDKIDQSTVSVFIRT